MHPRWQNPQRGTWPHIPAALRPWLLDTASMTRRLHRHLDVPLEVQVLRERWRHPSASLCTDFGLPHTPIWEREVLLHSQISPLMVARCAIPHQTCVHAKGRLTRLGNLPLGGYLFQRPPVIRRHLQWCTLGPIHRDYRWAITHDPAHPSRLWARRSALYWQQQLPIVVYEVFLSTITSMRQTASDHSLNHEATQ